MKRTGEKITPGVALLAALYFPLACAMYYFSEQSLHLGINILYKMVFAVLIAGLSIVAFLIKTDLTRAKALLQYIFLLILPHLIVLLVSLPLWTFRLSPMTVVRRGLFAQIYCIAIILAGAGMLYVFGRSGLWLNLFAMLVANFITILRAIRQFGFGVYMREFKELLLSFGKENGAAVSAAEINELTFAIGLYLLFLILDWKDARQGRFFWPALVLTAFCYFSGFKRIGAFAIAACVLAKLVLSVLTAGKTGRRGWLFWFSAAVVCAAFFYLFLVRNGLFAFLEKNFGINSMGRKNLSEFIQEYYYIGPGYLGQGAGFVSRLFSDLPKRYTVRALHNDILVLYIDIGFWGFWLWMAAFLPLRVMVVARWQGIRGGIMCACYSLFIILTAFTDNTIYYVYVIGAAAILTMGSYAGGQTGIRGGSA